MKKVTFPLMLAATMFLNIGFAGATTVNPKVETELTAEQRAELSRIMSRVEAIKAMDKSNLSKAERKDLRKELKEMKKKANGIGGGVYLSVGAIIVIILLLILIL